MTDWDGAPPPVVGRAELPPHPSLARIKVLHIVTKLWGGAGENTLLSAVRMDRGRYEPWIVACPGGHLWEEAHRAGVKVVQLPLFREVISPLEDLRVLIQLVKLIRRERFTVVHTHMSKAGFLGRLAAWITGVPVVLHTFHAFGFHNYMAPIRRRLYVALERMVSSLANHYIAVAPRVAREAIETRIAPPGRISVVPSAVDLEHIPERPDRSIRQELGIPAGTELVGMVGRIVPQKAPLDFIRMAALVARTHSDVAFVVVGDGTFEHNGLDREMRDEATRLGVNIVFTGFRTDAPRIASAFDIFVITSLYEGLGRSLTEALASGRPVVATAVNGVPDLVEHGSTGLLATPGDPRSLADCVLWLLENREKARRMGLQGRRRVRSMFTPDNMCVMLDELYSRLLGLPPSSPGSPLERVISLDGSSDTAGDAEQHIREQTPVSASDRV